MAQVETTTLYFINGHTTTEDDLARAAKIPGIVMFRNVQQNGSAVEDADQVSCGPGVTIPADQALGKTLVCPEKPLSLEIVPNNPSYDLSDVEHGDLRAIAKFMDGTVSDVTTSCEWTSGTPGTGTIGAATGIFTPVGVGTSLITATYNWAAFGGEPGVAIATGALTFATAPDADDTVVIGDITYTWKATPADTSSATAVQVKTSTTPEGAAANLLAAILATEYGRGTLFSSDAPVNAKADASINELTNDKIINLVSKIAGVPGNSVATTQTGDEATFAATTLLGGTNATAAVIDTTTVTVVA